jgi:DNA-binding response OmpR family regulator
MSKPKADILVVDDEPRIRELLVDALGGQGYAVHAAAGRSEAIRVAQQRRPDLLVTDLLLGDASGLDVIDDIRTGVCDVPAVVITGHHDAKLLSDASRRRPVEMITKPLDLDRLGQAVRSELQRNEATRRLRKRNRRLRQALRLTNRRRRAGKDVAQQTCSDLTAAYRSLSGQMAMQGIVLGYQKGLLSARCDDDVFANLFRMFVQRTGPVFGVAMVCDSSAQLRIVGRFGVPHPDSLAFCQKLTEPLIDMLLTSPQCTLIDAQMQEHLFDATIRRYLVGVSVLAVPLIPSPGEMIGVSVFYRKGEQPFTGNDVGLAEMVSHPTAVAIRRND